MGDMADYLNDCVDRQQDIEMDKELTMTDHDTLIELEPLLRELGWWPKSFQRSTQLDSQGSTHWVYREDYIEDEYTLAIATGRAEKELCGRGWYPCDEWGFYCKKFMSDMTGYRDHSLADALRVELNRKESE